MNGKTAFKPMSLSGRAFLVALLASAPGLALSQQEGPAEKAGQQIDQAGERAGDKIDEAQDAASKKAEGVGEYMGDAALTAKVKMGILKDPVLKVLEIHVTTTNGIAKLSGAVDSQQSIDRATEVARGVEGVASVENVLVVKPVD